MRSPPERWSLAIATLLLASHPSVATATELVPATGKIARAMGELTIGFEPGELETSELGAIVAFDARFARSTIEGRVIDSEAEAIEGSGTFELGGPTAIYVRIDLRAIAEMFAGRRIEIRYWQRPLGTRFSGTLGWVSGDVAAYLDADNYDAVASMGSLAFQPTGRATDDGWEEWTSGPIDFELGHRLAPVTISFYDESLGGLGEGIATWNESSRARLDALTIADLGEATVPDAACTFANRDAACGAIGTCFFGQCIDAAAVLGPAIADPQIRADYLDRYAVSFTRFEGGRAPLARADSLRAAFDALKTETSPRRFREGLALAIHDLGDGHASPPYASTAYPPSAGVCAYLGDADLLPDRVEAPLVADFDQASPIGALLQTGDAIVAIDGLAPRDWAVLARARLGYGGDPAGRDAIEAASLVDGAFHSGSVLSIARCAIDTSSTAMIAPCTEAETQRFDVDLGALAAPIWSGPLAWASIYPRTCDFRFRRVLEAPNARDYTFAGHADEDGIRVLQINGVPDQQWQGGAEWFAAVDEAFADAPQRMILDQRLGNGGSPTAVDRIGAYLLAANELYGMRLYPRVDGDLDGAARDRFWSCATSQAVLGVCGYFNFWPLGYGHPSVGRSENARLAILDGLDVSGNDFLPKMLTFRTRGATRFFGPSPTFGAFGAVASLPALLGDYAGGSYQVQDTVFSASEMDQRFEFTTSTGIAPDERVLERQSDAVRGVDTMLERAKEWVLQ